MLYIYQLLICRETYQHLADCELVILSAFITLYITLYVYLASECLLNDIDVFLSGDFSEPCLDANWYRLLIEGECCLDEGNEKLQLPNESLLLLCVK